MGQIFVLQLRRTNSLCAIADNKTTAEEINKTITKWKVRYHLELIIYESVEIKLIIFEYISYKTCNCLKQLCISLVGSNYVVLLEYILSYIVFIVYIQFL